MNIRGIRKILLNHIGKKVRIIYYGGRNKKEVYIGIVDGIYYNVFTLKLANGCIKCFTYTDILTKTIYLYI